MEELLFTIPRDIKVKEIVAYGLNGKQMLYLGVGMVGVVTTLTVGAFLPLDLKIVGCIFSVVGSLCLTLIKIHGQELDRYLWNSIKYPLRQREFGGDTFEKDSVFGVGRKHGELSPV